jgi:hypothetical protein
MKLRITILTAVVALALLFAFAACESQEIPPEIVANALYSVKIGDLEVTGIPEPIEDDTWADEEYEVATALYETIVVKGTGRSDKLITARVNSGARVTYGLAKGGARPGAFSDLRKPVTFDLDDYLYIKVSTTDANFEVTSNYYRFSPYEASPVRELSNITLAGRDPTEQTVSNNKFFIPPPSVTPEAMKADVANTARRGRLDITNLETANTLIEAETKDTVARVRYAFADTWQDASQNGFSEFVAATVRTKPDPNDPTQTTTVKTLNRTFNDANIIVVEVTAQDDTTNYYAFQVWAGRMATINRLTFNNVLAAGKGVQASTWTGVVAGKFPTADQTNGTGNYAIDIQLDDPQGLADWVRIAGPNAAAPGAATGPWGTQESNISFTKGQTLAIRVQSANRITTDVRYYKVEIDLLATDFTAHPKSAVYYVGNHGFPVGQPVLISDNPTTVPLDRTIEPLTVTLSKPGGTYTYQWYESNSWYGGYGFDRDGRINGVDPDYGSDITMDDLLAGQQMNSTTITEAKSRLGTGLGLDEKANVSLHNGGNNYYRLTSPGRKIPGPEGTAPTYTPKIDSNKRPFIGGYSNQTHYYWVVVTDTTTTPNLTATSDRAAIVAEWGEEWDLGKPTATKKTKKYHIIDLHAYQDPSAIGLKETPKNIEPFTFKRQTRRIPVTFPDGFNISDYTIAICQAKFYLGDGKEWIQNWTQGDIGFGKAGEDDIIYYNLTNNNAGLGLVGDAKEPQGGSLTYVPTHIVVKPAGEKPPKQMPPFTSTNDILGRPIPQNINDAQGWFTPYIEIVELRFEGPARD